MPLKAPTAHSLGIIKGLLVAHTTNKGLGVYTTKAIKAHTVVEVAPVIIMPLLHKQHLDNTLLHDYIFMWGNNEQQCCMALGWVPLYNHSYNSNCQYTMDYATKHIIITTVTAIPANHELTINYNGTYNDATKVWFDVAE